MDVFLWALRVIVGIGNGGQPKLLSCTGKNPNLHIHHIVSDLLDVLVHGVKRHLFNKYCGCRYTPKPPPIAEFAAEFLSAENVPKKVWLPKIRRKSTDIQIIKWIQHSNKWLACYLKWTILVISKLLVITDGCRFCNSKETDNNNKYVGSHFSLGSTAQPKLFVISWILAAKCL